MQLPSKIFCLSTYTIIICCILLRIIFPHAIASDSTFIPNYYAHWGLDHFTLLQEGSEEVQLLIDQASSGYSFSTFIQFSTRWLR